MERDKLISIMESKDKSAVDNAGGVFGIARELGSDAESGINDTSESGLSSRRSKYGVNVVERKPPPGFIALFIEAMQDTTIVILLGASLVAIICGASICGVKIGGACRRKPLWDSGATKELWDYEVRLDLFNSCNLFLIEWYTGGSRRPVSRVGRGFGGFLDRFSCLRNGCL